jgi:hypothetical protein
MNSPRRRALATVLTGSAALALLTSAPAGAESRARDSDDLVCHRGALADPGTLAACQRLRGEAIGLDQAAAERRGGRWRDSDDFNCHHGAPGDPRTAAACDNLRRDVPGEPGSIDPGALG